MSAPKNLRALVTINPKEEEKEEGNFDPKTIQSKITEIDLVKLHSEHLIPSEFQLEVPRE